MKAADTAPYPVQWPMLNPPYQMLARVWYRGLLPPCCEMRNATATAEDFVVVCKTKVHIHLPEALVIMLLWYLTHRS